MSTQRDHDLALLTAGIKTGWYDQDAHPHPGPTTSSTPTTPGDPLPAHPKN